MLVVLVLVVLFGVCVYLLSGLSVMVLLGIGKLFD